MQVTQRNTNIELLRAVLMVFICFWHVIIHGYNFLHIGECCFFSQGETLFLTFFCTLFLPSVYCFILISGYYGINFSLRKSLYLIVLGISCSLLSYGYRRFIGEELGIRDFLMSLFPISCRKWWFFTAYMMLFVSSPFVNKGLECLSSKLRWTLLLFMTGFVLLGIFNIEISEMSSSFFALLYMYVLGRQLSLESISINYRWLCLIYAICFITLWLISYKIAINNSTQFLLSGFYKYNNLLNITMSLCVFLLVVQLPIWSNKYLNWFLSTILSVYLLTEGIGTSLYKYEAAILKSDLLYGMSLTLIVFVICILYGHIVKAITNALFMFSFKMRLR